VLYKLREKIVFLIISNIFINFLNIIVSFFLFSVLDVTLVGIIAFSNSLIGFFTLFLDIGLDSIYLQKNAEKDFQDYFSIYFFYKFIIIIANFLPLFIIITLLDLDTLEFEFLSLKAISTVFDSMALIWSINLLGNKKIFKHSIVNLIINIVRNGLILLLIINYNVVSDPLQIIGQIYIISSCLSFALFLIISKSEFHFNKINKEKLISFIKATKPLLVTSVFGVVVTNGGFLILDLSTNHDVLAYYYLVTNYIIFIPLLITRAIRTILLTIFPQEFKNQNLKGIEQITHISEKYSSIFFLILIMFVFFNAELLFRIFLPKYLESLQYVYILIFIPYLSGINRPYISHLIPAQKQRLLSYYLFFKLLINLTLIIIVVPEYFFSIRMLGGGALGFAFVTFGMWSMDIPIYRHFSKKLGISWNRGIIIHVFLAGMAFGITKVISLLFSSIFLFNDFIYIALTSLISTGLFLIGLIIFKEIRKEDFKFFINLFKIRNYIKSLMKEIKGKESTEDE
jgi:O-antigen/teichoic acid export membrane protein